MFVEWLERLIKQYLRHNSFVILRDHLEICWCLKYKTVKQIANCEVVLVLSGCCNKIQQTGELIKQQYSFFTVLEAESPESLHQLIWCLVRTSWFIHGAFLPHKVEGTGDPPWGLFYKGTNHILETSTLSTAQRPHLQIPSPLGVSISTWWTWAGYRARYQTSRDSPYAQSLPKLLELCNPKLA